MEEFEKWLDAHPGRYTIPALQMGWKGALEWLRDNREMKTWDDIDDMIKKELEE